MEERNFRSYYYEKVGFRVVEEKKSLEILMKEKPIDRNKLTQFALRFPVPALHRSLLWKMLLDILPTHSEQHKFVTDQQNEQCGDLTHTLHVLQLSKQQTPKSHLFTLMKYLEEGNLKIDYHNQLATRESRVFITINQALSDIIDCDSAVYWMSKGFFRLLKIYKPTITSLVTYTDKLLLKQDEELYRYLVKSNIWKSMPLEDWFENCFADVLPIIPLQKVWDKVIGGSAIIMVFVAISLLSALRQVIFNAEKVSELIESANQLTETSADLVVTEAIECWQQNGSPLIPGSNNDGLKELHKHPAKTTDQILNFSKATNPIRKT